MKKKKTIILNANSESIMDTEQGRKYIEYAKENNLQLIAEAHYSFVLPFLSPEKFVEKIMIADPDVLLTDEVLFYANLYHDGKLLESLKERGITVLITDIDFDLLELTDRFDDDFKHCFKNAVRYAFAKTFNRESIENIGRNIAVISCESQSENLTEFIEMLNSKGIRNVSVFIIDELTEHMIPKMNQVINKNDISSIIICDDIQMNQILLDYLSTLIDNKDINIYFKEQIQDEIDISQCMKIS